MRRKSRPSRMFLADHFFQRIDVFLQSRYACCGARSVACPARIIFFKRIDVFLQSRYACCGVRLRVRWLAPPGAHNDLRWFRWRFRRGASETALFRKRSQKGFRV